MEFGYVFVLRIIVDKSLYDKVGDFPCDHSIVGNSQI